jgi:hypothetical protein
VVDVKRGDPVRTHFGRPLDNHEVAALKTDRQAGEWFGDGHG